MFLSMYMIFSLRCKNWILKTASKFKEVSPHSNKNIQTWILKIFMLG